MPLLVCSAVAGHSDTISVRERASLAAQSAGWVGDLALLGDSPAHFARGAAAFGAGHACYTAGLLSVRRQQVSLVGPATVAAVWAIGAPRTLVAAYRQNPRLAPVLGAYSVALSFTMASATVLDPTMPRSTRRRIQTGAALFMLSDSLLGIRRFVASSPPAGLEAAVMATYATAQYLLADLGK